MNGWVKLHRKILDNPRFYKNSNTLAVWIWLLCHAKDGKVTCGRIQIANDLGISESSVYRALKSFTEVRMEDKPLLDIKSNNRFSTIYICNWDRYQSKPNSTANNQRTTSEQPANTNKNKELRIKNIDTNVSTEISKLYYQVIKKLDLPVTNHNTIRAKIRELEKSPEQDRIINYLVFMRDNYEATSWSYKPSINTGLDIFTKRKQIENSLKRVATNRKGIKL